MRRCTSPSLVVDRQHTCEELREACSYTSSLARVFWGHEGVVITHHLRHTLEERWAEALDVVRDEVHQYSGIENPGVENMEQLLQHTETFTSLVNLWTTTQRYSFLSDVSVKSPRVWIHMDSNGASAGNNYSSRKLCISLIRFRTQVGTLSYSHITIDCQGRPLEVAVNTVI